MNNWLKNVRLYFDKRMLSILLLGFSSGLPLALTTGTLTIWLSEGGVSKASIGAFALVGLPYTFKFIWSPLVDQMPIPFLTKMFGRRRAWMLFTQLILAVSIIALGQTHPSVDPTLTAFLALLVAFCSASQDIVIDAFRVDILDEKTYGAGAASAVLGYRISMLVSGAGALYLATFYSWSFVYSAMAALIGIGIITTLLCKEPRFPEKEKTTSKQSSLRTWIHDAIVSPFTNFATHENWIVILIFIMLYKLGDAFAGNMTSPFFIETGFSKIEIANITKIFGFIAMIVGIFAGNFMVARFGIMRALFICGFFQMSSNLVFILQAYVGYNVAILALTIGTENIAGGMGTAALVAYLSSLCNISYSATQYALLSSLTAVGRTFLSSTAGVIAENLSWTFFFIVSTIIALPGMITLLWLRQPVPCAQKD
jgi:MFS transporter, PAT family, beta-lactamase induction signal transducer AmpG